MGRRRSVSMWANVSHFIDRHGHTRWRFRKTGFPTVTLHGEPGSPQFMAELAAARAQAPLSIGPAKVAPGSFSALCAAYYASADFKRTRPITQATYRNTLERFRAKNGDRPYAALRHEDVRRFLDQKAETPSAANHLLQVMKILFRFALERGFVTSDPTHHVRKLAIEGDGFAPWSDEQIAAYRKRWPTGTRQRLAFELLYQTSQRRGDVVLLGRQHIKSGRLNFRQSKTGAEVSIPITPELQAELEHVPAGQMTFLQTAYGHSMSAAGFGNWFRDQCDAAGVKGVSAHGLRKAAAREIAEGGGTSHEIMAVTGHRTLAEVDRYTKSAARAGLADMGQGKRKKRTG